MANCLQFNDGGSLQQDDLPTVVRYIWKAEQVLVLADDTGELFVTVWLFSRMSLADRNNLKGCGLKPGLKVICQPFLLWEISQTLAFSEETFRILGCVPSISPSISQSRPVETYVRFWMN